MKYTPLELDNDKRIKTVYFPPNEGSEFIVKHSDQEGSIESRVGAKSTPHYIGAPYWELKPMTLITGQNGHSKTELLSHIRKAYRSESD